MKQKILITGGAGYIGSHTAVALVHAGFEPIILDNFCTSEKSAITGLSKIIGFTPIVIEGDCNDPQVIESVFTNHEIQGIIHFAAFKAVGESTKLPLKYYHNNIGSLVLLLQSMEKFGVKNLVFSSSCTVYGEPKILPATEDTPRQDAESPYGNTKKICEDILVDVTKSQKGNKIISLRYFNPIGAHPSSEIGELPIGVPANLVPFITQTAIGKRERLTIFGDDYDTLDGTCVRDYIHVMDLADAHVKALSYLAKQEDNFFDILNVGTGNGNTVLEVVKTFEKVSGQNLNYQIGPRRPGDVVKTWASTEKITRVLGWKPQFTLEDSLRDAWNWELKLAKR
ncbi:UDP-glucose 4-epimerase GalE [Mongoliitalea daihaiensis]|uniref:UDP-glucose 4-epimerase GalE n=1 Tax=Mongoliitalea daihaiensis TaxID=2782006 RepID=UPI001F3818A7|nr:UDP-glucose 4-epimerase GalE [Mongoliitalea daihaiensis]UJP63854.1 UDP-glucose 4-epimerase GalE [Mongoliitalea daihaiensis]